MSHPRRWRNNGDDWETGSQTMHPNGVPRGAGGLVSWRVRPVRWTAIAWTRTEQMKPRDFARDTSARRAVERWLENRAPEKAKP